MAYSKNILPKFSAYYTLNQASIEGTELIINSGGYAEINISQQMLPKLTSKMLVVAHPSVFSDYYTNDKIQINLSIITADGEHLEILIPVTAHSSGVFNTEINLPEVEYLLFTFRISSTVPVTLYNWELCAEEAVDMTTVIEGVEQELPKLLYDYNTYSYAVDQDELVVGLISCFLHGDTDLQGHFTISFFATERCNVHVRIKDNGATELFSPQVYTVERGYASISVPHAYLKKKATDHAFAVSIQCTNGQLSIPVRGVLYTIDGGYLATRLLDAGIDVQDISIRQTNNDLTPSEIWAIGFESRRLIVKNRVYSKLTKANWVAVKDFGEGLAAAIEFSGRWIGRNNSEKYTIETEVMPFVFIVDLDGTLTVYSGDSYGEYYILDTNVSAVVACQGYNSIHDILQDQGLVVMYIKEGNVYYRQWLYDEASQKYMWYPIETLYDGNDASFVSIHRLPDYRMGICIVCATETKWLITDRTYVSQAVKPEFISTYTDNAQVFTVIETSKVNEITGVATLNTFEPAMTHDGEFIMTFEGPIVFLKGRKVEDLLYNTKVYINNVLQENIVKSLIVNDNTISVKLNKAVNGNSTVKIDFGAFYHIAIRIYNNCLHVLKSKTYSWYLELPIITTQLTHNESANVRVTTALNVKVKPIISNTLPQLEIIDVGMTSALGLSVREIIQSDISHAEVIDTAVNPTVSLVVSQTGTASI